MTPPEEAPLTYDSDTLVSAAERKHTVRFNRASYKEAKLAAQAAKLHAKELAVQAKLQNASRHGSIEREDADLARQGMKRQWLTGRIVPIRGSYRAKPHTRQIGG